MDAVTLFSFVQRAVDTHLGFLIWGFARKQSNDNPVYYAQYAHARICSIFATGFRNLRRRSPFELLTHEKEIALMKYINEFTNVVSDAARSRAPHKVCNLYSEAGTAFPQLL